MGTSIRRGVHRTGFEYYIKKKCTYIISRYKRSDAHSATFFFYSLQAPIMVVVMPSRGTREKLEASILETTKMSKAYLMDNLNSCIKM